MIDHVRQQIRRGWERTAGQYAVDRPKVFQRFAARLVALLDPRPGQVILDVGAGPGLATLRAAKRVGPQGHVVGLDFAQAMLVQLRTAYAATAIDSQGRVSAVQMDAERLGVPAARFDGALCAFALFQFVDMGQALAEMRRALKPGGRVALSNWGPGFFTPVARMQRDLFREYGLRPLLTHPIAFQPAQMEGLLAEAGFRDITLIQERVELWFATPQKVWEWNLAMGPLPIMLETQLSVAQRQELAQRYRDMLAPLVTPQGIACTFHPLYAVGCR